ncbi:MAG: hypothetical protein RI907_2543 [Pseudomonadota bacterium]|jgi:hypothetical protein
MNTFAPRRLALAVALTLPALAQATPFSIFEARGFAMGGAGVASSEYAAASLYNPALLAVPSESNRVSFILPAVGARASGTDGAVTAVQDFNDHKTIDNMTAAADAFQAVYDVCRNTPGSCNTTNLQARSSQLASATSQLKTDLQALSGKTYNVNAGAVAAIALPKWQYKGALSMNVEFFGKATPYIDAADLADVDTVINGLQTYASSGNINALSTVVDGSGNVKIGSNGSDYRSNFKIIGVAVADLGLSLARAFTVADQSILVGITPKIQQVNTVAYTANMDNNDFKLNENKKTATGFNMDVGVAKTFEPDSAYERVRLGLVVRNLIPHTYKTTDPTQDVKMAPQLRVGAAWTSKYGTITSDLDLTANKVVGTGTDSSQVFAIGGELNAWNVAKLRAGYRNDFKAKYSAVTAGISLLGVQLSAAYSKDRELAAMLQFGASF